MPEFYGSVVLRGCPVEIGEKIVKGLDENDSINEVVKQPGASEDRFELRASVTHRSPADAMVLLGLGVRRLLHDHGGFPRAVAVQGSESV